jgi:hypothetical protein
MAADGVIYPAAYLRRGARVTERELSGELLHQFQDGQHARELKELLSGLVP